MATTAQLNEIEHLLRVALNCLGDARQRSGDAAAAAAGSAAWRIADAALLMREACESEGITGCGITEATGRGGSLPTRMTANEMPKEWRAPADDDATLDAREIAAERAAWREEQESEVRDAERDGEG